MFCLQDGRPKGVKDVQREATINIAFACRGHFVLMYIYFSVFTVCSLKQLTKKYCNYNFGKTTKLVLA